MNFQMKKKKRCRSYKIKARHENKKLVKTDKTAIQENEKNVVKCRMTLYSNQFTSIFLF